MYTAYVVVTVVTAAAAAYAASADVTRPEWLLGNMINVGVSEPWLFPLGAIKAAGAIGLLVGIGVPALGVTASVGLVLFFVGAVITHFRARCWNIAAPGVFLLLATCTLVLRLAST